ncbi:hypothetical protein [Archangium lipolyticum]|uniref:hypothetical protein n=1 Tax=Archangium lipolyticum TaxID=2970465 RepID=UPI00214A03F3|nr:hypothetical protein [Archangium lipolyticum]
MTSDRLLGEPRAARLVAFVLLNSLLAAGCGLVAQPVGGSVQGLRGSLVLQLNGGEQLTVSNNGPFLFPKLLEPGTAYQVAILTQPRGQTCEVTQGSGDIGDEPATNVKVACQDLRYGIGVTVSQLTGTLVLQNNGTDPITITANGAHTFPSRLSSGEAYKVTVRTHPEGSACVVEGGRGTLDAADVTNILVICGPGLRLGGTLTYDHVPTRHGPTGSGLDYANKKSRPVRRALVQAVEQPSGTVLASTLTRDDGTYSMSLPGAQPYVVRVYAGSAVTDYQPDGIGQDDCRGASWEVHLVDNTREQARYAMQSDTFTGSNLDADMHAGIAHDTSGYTDRTGAPFALLDTLVSAMERVCTADPKMALPLLRANWSPNNTDESGKWQTGAIGTSHYTRVDDVSNLFILGQEGVDTDEYDDHVIAHEFGHFLEDRLYRSDSIGGSHSSAQSLVPTVAFGEGYGNAFSGMTFNDPVYVDTSGRKQGSGFTIPVAVTPQGDDRGVYSETSVQYLLWSLYENRDATASSGNYDRIHDVLRNAHRTQPAFTTVHTFAAAYNQRYGASAETLRDLWERVLDTPYDALCAGRCKGSGDTADLFDVDNDIGAHYAQGAVGARGYPADTFNYQPADFWRLYRVLASGANEPTAHDRTNSGGYNYAYNKFGYNRWYRFTATGTRTTVSLSNLQGATCAQDVLDFYVYGGGELVARAATENGCEQTTFDSVPGTEYVLDIEGYESEVTGWTVTITP